MEVEQIKEMNLSHLQQLAREHGVKGYYTMRKPALVETLTKLFTAEKEKTTASGLLETMNEGFGFLRRQHYYYSDDDIYISASQIRRFNLRNGDLVSGIIRPPKDNERYYALLQVEEINGKDPDSFATRSNFHPSSLSIPAAVSNGDRTGSFIDADH